VISTLVAVIAIIISLVSLRRTRLFNDRQLGFLAENDKLIRLQRSQLEQAEKEKIASDVSVRVYNAANGKRLGIVNSGRVLVENVTLKYLEQAEYGSPFIPEELREKLPFKHIHPGEEHNVILVLHDQTPMSFDVQLNWEENDGLKYTKTTTITP
jgi:hypothetical protein